MPSYSYAHRGDFDLKSMCFSAPPIRSNPLFDTTKPLPQCNTFLCKQTGPLVFRSTRSSQCSSLLRLVGARENNPPPYESGYGRRGGNGYPEEHLAGVWKLDFRTDGADKRTTVKEFGRFSVADALSHMLALHRDGSCSNPQRDEKWVIRDLQGRERLSGYWRVEGDEVAPPPCHIQSPFPSIRRLRPPADVETTDRLPAQVFGACLAACDDITPRPTQPRPLTQEPTNSRSHQPPNPLPSPAPQADPRPLPPSPTFAPLLLRRTDTDT
jgi:hypothetical protein